MRITSEILKEYRYNGELDQALAEVKVSHKVLLEPTIEALTHILYSIQGLVKLSAKHKCLVHIKPVFKIMKKIINEELNENGSTGVSEMTRLIVNHKITNKINQLSTQFFNGHESYDLFI